MLLLLLLLLLSTWLVSMGPASWKTAQRSCCVMLGLRFWMRIVRMGALLGLERYVVFVFVFVGVGVGVGVDGEEYGWGYGVVAVPVG